MSPIAIVLLVAAVVLVLAAEWGRVSRGRTIRSVDIRHGRSRKRRKSNLRVVETTDSEEFARSVERDLAALPTIDEQDAKQR
jgi:hypothetical protein